MSPGNPDTLQIVRLDASDAPLIVACFQSVYGDTYAHTQFYDAAELQRQLNLGQLRSVGAKSATGELLAHMAMTLSVDTGDQATGSALPPALASRTCVEMGNTVVTPAARGGGIAWRVGAELQNWAVELGYRGFLHYPTTDHEIMQRQSVQNGFETGLMLGYIPADTDGQVQQKQAALRNAATIVYQPIGELTAESTPAFLPDPWAELLQELAVISGLRRQWQTPSGVVAAPSRLQANHHKRRALGRLRIITVGHDFAPLLDDFAATSALCHQLDFAMTDPGISVGLSLARQQGFCFCGWLPGLYGHDVLRLQKFHRAQTNLLPQLANPQAQRLLAIIQDELAA
ncbi:MAG: hypothetical protein AAF993_05510 [Pseudomonadota bacterium]